LEAPGDAVEADTAATGFGFDVTGAGLLKFDVSRAGTEIGHALDAVDTDAAGAALSFDGGTDVLNFDVAGACGGVDGGSAGEGDLVVDADVVEEVVVVTFPDGDVVTILDDRRVADDLLNAAVGVAATTHPAMAGVD